MQQGFVFSLETCPQLGVPHWETSRADKFLFAFRHGHRGQGSAFAPRLGVSAVKKLPRHQYRRRQDERGQESQVTDGNALNHVLPHWTPAFNLRTVKLPSSSLNTCQSGG